MNYFQISIFTQKNRPRAKKVFGGLVVLFFLIHLGYLLQFKWVNPSLTLTQWAARRDGYALDQHWMALEDISADFQLAVLCSEDQRFTRHNGFDMKSIKLAIFSHQKGMPVCGASTISQQTAKNVFLWQKRSWVRKGLEAYYTIAMELLYGKRRIFELYLNVAEMGPGIFGVDAAAQHYFHKSAQALGAEESALLVAGLPNPKRFDPVYPSAQTQQRAKWILEQMDFLNQWEEVQQLLRRPDTP